MNKVPEKSILNDVTSSTTTFNSIDDSNISGGNSISVSRNKSIVRSSNIDELLKTNGKPLDTVKKI